MVGPCKLGLLIVTRLDVCDVVVCGGDTAGRVGDLSAFGGGDTAVSGVCESVCVVDTVASSVDESVRGVVTAGKAGESS